jgi:hypothetical protein
VDEGARAQASAAAAIATDAKAAADAAAASLAALGERVQAIEDDIAAAGDGAGQDGGGSVTVPDIAP